MKVCCLFLPERMGFLYLSVRHPGTAAPEHASTALPGLAGLPTAIGTGNEAEASALPAAVHALPLSIPLFLASFLHMVSSLSFITYNPFSNMAVYNR